MSRKEIIKYHRYLGLISGLPALVISLTGSLYVFRTELTQLLLSFEFDINKIEWFFSFIIEGHQFFWLPSNIGRPFVTMITVLFVVELITGIVISSPKQLYQWVHNLKRWSGVKLHIMAGVYFILPLNLLSLTGIIYGLGGIENASVMSVIGRVHRGFFWGVIGQTIMLMASIIGGVLSVTGYQIFIKRCIKNKK